MMDQSRRRLHVYDIGYDSWVSIDDPIEVLEGTPIAGKAWADLVRYIQLNRALLLDLWEGKIQEADYANRQKPIL